MKIDLKPTKFKFDKKLLFYFISMFLIFFIMNSCRWTYHNFHRINFDEIGIVLNSGLTGTDSGLLWSFIRKAVFNSLKWTVVISIFLNFFRNHKKIIFLVYAVCLVFLCQKVKNSNIQFGSFFNFNHSTFYESEYIDPKNTNIKWDKKRNVLFIALESIEKVYGSTDVFNEVLTPNITNIEKQNISFENYHSLSGLSHTIAAITGFTTGLPLFYTSYSQIEKMVGASGIGSIFKDAGYETWSIFPATGKFSLKGNFMHRMGFDNVIDGEDIRKSMPTPPTEAPFYGVDDGTLFDWSKETIKNIVKSKKPYFLFMETINTHCKGYFTEYCKNIGFKQKRTEDIIKCDDKIISDFVKWFQKTDPSAVIILINDHPQHSGVIMKKLNLVKNRNLANVFINTNVFKGADLNRPVSAMDFFPTIVESAGAKIDGCKLGLGVSLTKRCQNVQTLRERYNDQELENLMEQKNNLYYKLSTGKEKK